MTLYENPTSWSREDIREQTWESYKRPFNDHANTPERILPAPFKASSI